MSELAHNLSAGNIGENSAQGPELVEVPVDDITITHDAIRHILNAKNHSTPRSRLAELLRFTFIAKGQPNQFYAPPTDYMVTTFRNLPSWVGVEGSPHGPGNYHRIEKLHANKREIKYLDEDMRNLGVTYEWVANTEFAMQFDRLSRELAFGVLAVKLITLEGQDQYWKDF